MAFPEEKAIKSQCNSKSLLLSKKKLLVTSKFLFPFKNIKTQFLSRQSTAHALSHLILKAIMSFIQLHFTEEELHFKDIRKFTQGCSTKSQRQKLDPVPSSSQSQDFLLLSEMLQKIQFAKIFINDNTGSFKQICMSFLLLKKMNGL